MTWKSKKKIRELLAGEEGTVLKDFGNPIRIAVVFPNIYNVGMSNLGVHHIYRMLNSLRGVLCERVFLPDDGEEEILSIESQRPLSDFSALLFTIPFENDIKNIEKILKNVEPMPFLAIGGAIPRLLPDFFRKRFDIVSELDAEEGLLEILSKLGYEEKVKFEKKTGSHRDMDREYRVRLYASGRGSKGLPQPLPLLRRASCLFATHPVL